jgi:hypothetical protein
LIGIVGTGAGLIGCSEQGPTDPPRQDVVAALAQPAQETAIQPVPIPILVDGPIYQSEVRISAAQGGTITAGRFTLQFPPGALRKDTVITLRDISAGSGRVECEALPEGLQFRVPVMLTTRFSDIVDPQGYSIYCVVSGGKGSEKWEFVGGQASSEGVTAPLRHFSRYAPGKAGW